MRVRVPAVLAVRDFERANAAGELASLHQRHVSTRSAHVREGVTLQLQQLFQRLVNAVRECQRHDVAGAVNPIRPSNGLLDFSRRRS